MPSLGDEPSSTLEGRDAELSVLAAAFDDACRGHGRVVVVSGEAGIGKSALLAGLAELAKRAGVSVAWGRAWEFADAPAYFPLWPCFSELGLRELAAEESSPFVLWERVLSALSAASRQGPRLWLLEDLHAADVQTLDVLSFLAQPLRVLKVLVVVTARPRDPRLGERAEQRLLRMARDGLDLRLAPLAQDAVARLARRHAGELSKSALLQLLELTSGNPLFVVECARAIKLGGLPALRGVSPTIVQVVTDRLQLLPDATRALLESAAVLGRDFSAALLGHMHGLLPARVVDALLPALRGGVLLERKPGSFAFSHVVVQGAVYETLAAGRRTELHAKAEQALGKLPEAPEIALERARHALGGLRPETARHALSLVLTTGAALEASGAFDRAHALYARARDKIASGELALELSFEQLLHMADVAGRAGRVGESRALSSTVLRRARSRNARRIFALAALELGRVLRPGIIDHELVAALREALQHVDIDEPQLACRLSARLAAALQPDPNPQGPVELATRAIACARRLADDSLLLEVLDVAGSAYAEYAPLELRLETSQALLEQANRAHDLERAQRALARLALDRATLGDFDAFERHVAEMLSLAERAGRVQAKIRPLLMASLSASNRGKVAESDGFLAEAEQLLSLTDDDGLVLSFNAHRLSRAFMLHRDPELELLEATLPTLVHGLPDSGLLLSTLRGAVRARLERLGPAREDLRRAWSQLGPRAGAFVPLLAETAAAVDDRELCAECHARLVPLAGTDALGGHVSVSYEGPVDRLLGLLEAALGQPASAEQKLRATLALAERRGFDTWVAQGRADLAKLLGSQGRSAEARGYWQGAAELAERRELVGLLARASARLGGAGAAPHVRSAADFVAARLLMTREGELYRLELGALSARIRATRGAELLARLVEAPDREIHVLALAFDEGAAKTESNAGDHVDPRALRQYQKRLQELRLLQEEAERAADRGRLEALRAEHAALEREVSRALGLGGRSRPAGSTTERARVNVQRRLKDALARVSEANPELGAWLARRLRTGTYCSFHPNY